MKVGDVVKFKNPSEDEVNDVFIVVELRGDRTLVGMICDWPIPPTFVYLNTDLVEA